MNLGPGLSPGQPSCLETQPEHAAAHPLVVWELFSGAQSSHCWTLSGHTSTWSRPHGPRRHPLPQRGFSTRPGGCAGQEVIRGQETAGQETASEVLARRSGAIQMRHQGISEDVFALSSSLPVALVPRRIHWPRGKNIMSSMFVGSQTKCAPSNPVSASQMVTVWKLWHCPAVPSGSAWEAHCSCASLGWGMLWAALAEDRCCPISTPGTSGRQ